MKIGAYNFSSQFNMNSRFSADTIKQVESLENAAKVSEVKKVEKPADSLTLTGGDLFNKSQVKPVTYNKYNPIGVINSKPAEVLDDFSLVSAKEDKITSRLNKVDENINYQELISDEKMDSFLKNAFKLF